MDNTGNGVMEATRHFVKGVQQIDRSLRRSGVTAPPNEVKEASSDLFWSMVHTLDRYAREIHAVDPGTKQMCRDIAGPWLLRSKYFNRAGTKPHGYAGDYRMIEWIYDAETDPCNDLTQPGIVNCLDHIFRTVYCVQSVWERRRWFESLLRREYERSNGRFRVLDIACGGARYIRDFLASLPNASTVEVTLVDQDPSALAFCRTVSLAPWEAQLQCLSISVSRLAKTLAEGDFDVVISTGLFDYLDQDFGAELVEHLVHLTAPAGVTALSNFHPDDPSRYIVDWLCDWPLIYRDDPTVAALFPRHVSPITERSHNQALVYGWTRRES